MLMDLSLISMVSMGGLALLLSVVLVLANQKLRVEVDPKVEQIIQVLPGINCGACGSASCEHFSEQVIEGTQRSMDVSSEVPRWRPRWQRSWGRKPGRFKSGSLWFTVAQQER